MAQTTLSQPNKQTGALSVGMIVFLLVWFGQMVSYIGSGMTCFAQSISVYTNLGGSIANLGWLAVLAQLPGILLSPIAGVLADRYDRRVMMIVCDTVAAAFTLLLRMLVVSGSYQIWHIYVIVVFISIANHFQWPAYFAAISSLVPKQNLGQANGLVAGGRAIGQIAAPFMAGILVSLFRFQGVIAFDLATYIFATAILLFVRFPKPEASAKTETTASKSTFLREAIYGFQYITSRPGLIGIIALISAGNFMLGGVTNLVMPMALTITSIRGYGSMLSVGAISLLLGGMVMGLWGGPKRRVLGIIAFMLVQGVMIMLGSLFPGMLLFVIAISFFNFAATMVNGCGQVIWQTKVPPAMQGRVMASGTMITTLALEVGIMGVAITADHVRQLFIQNPFFSNLLPGFFGTGDGRGLAFVMTVLGLLYTLTAIGGYLHPRVRFLERELPDMLPASDDAPPGTGGKLAAVPIYQMDFGNRPSSDK